MTTSFRSQKALFLAIFLSISLFWGGSVKAQTVSSPATSEQVDAMKETLISLLTQLIAQLQAQISALIAQQASTTEAVVQVQKQINQPVLGTTEKVGALKISNLRFEETSRDDQGNPVTYFRLESNKPLDLTQTILIADGQSATSTFELVRRDGNALTIKMTPGLPSFTRADSYGVKGIKALTLKFKAVSGETATFSDGMFTFINDYSKPGFDSYKVE